MMPSAFEETSGTTRDAHARGHQERPEQIGVALDVLPRVVDETMPGHEFQA